MEALGQRRYGHGLLLVIIIAALGNQVPVFGFWVDAVNNEDMMMIKKGVIFLDNQWFQRRLLQEVTNPPTLPPPPPPPSGGDGGRVGTPSPPPPSFQSTNPPPSKSFTPPPPPFPSFKPPPPPSPSFNPPPPPEPRINETNTSPTTPTIPTVSTKSVSKSRINTTGLVIGLVVAGLVFFGICGFCVYYWNSKSSHIVKPWMAGLSGQLQKVFVTGVPKLNRSELESACEEFSNVIGTSSIGKVYKGTLSSGSEIAVISLVTDTVNDWSKSLRTQFRKKVEALSKINHKNFVNLIGYCEEDAPFTRMLVFEYAPNGTLYEHLHFQDSEHLSWAMRLRISMGISYCLEHMHNLKPPAIHKNLSSSAISLSEDYAAKVSDFTFWNERGPAEIQSAGVELMQPSVRSNIACFGKLLFETMTGKGTHLMSCDYIHSWASDYLGESATKVPGDIVDPTLSSVPPGELIEVLKVIQLCVQPDSKSKPSMKEITNMLREITGIRPVEASPKISPLWWAELEVITTDQN